MADHARVTTSSARRSAPTRVVAAVLAAIAAGVVGLSAQDRQRSTDGERSLTHGGRQRTYLVRDFGRGQPAPLVIVLHGGGGNAANAVRMTGFDRVAAREGLVVVYPNGTAGRDRGSLLTWNAGHCCAAAMRNRVDDVGFIAAIIDALIASGRGDRSRVYVTGMSNGGMMAHRLGRELSDRLAAIAPVVGAVFGDEPAPQAAMPAFIVVGADDRTVPPGGGALRLPALLGRGSPADRDVAPAMAQATYWARHNGCGDPVRSETDAAVTSTWADCRSGAPVIFHSVTGNGHAWPGGAAGRRGAATPTTAFDATEGMWSFFSRQRRADGRLSPR
jgi:polyhydroxybutyrate depolymerase